MRLFVGLALPEPVLASLQSLQEGLPGVRWVPPERMHLTLRFIGEVAPERLDELAEALEGVTLEPFEMALSGVGCFGPPERPRTLWAGAEPEAPLRRLHEEVNERLAAFGGPPVGPDCFCPHVTLARPGRRPSPATDWLRHWRDYRSPAFPVNDFALFESRLSHEGAHYSIRERFILGD